MLCKHLSQGIKRLPARFLGTAIEKKVFFLILGGKAGLRKRNRKVCYQYEQSSKFGKPTGQLCNTAGWGCYILPPLTPFNSFVLVGAKKEGVLNY